MVSQEELLVIAELDRDIKLGNAITNLLNNADFQLIYKRYTQDLPLELTYSLGTLEKSQSNTDNVARRLESIALFKKFVEDTEESLATALAEKNRIHSSGVNE